MGKREKWDMKGKKVGMYHKKNTRMIFCLVNTKRMLYNATLDTTSSKTSVIHRRLLPLSLDSIGTLAMGPIISPYLLPPALNLVFMSQLGLLTPILHPPSLLTSSVWLLVWGNLPGST
jgi:hypothetical protein